jgi:hypothetical protein
VAQIASDALAERLVDWQVDTVFGLPGDGINGIMKGLRRHKDNLRQARSTLRSASPVRSRTRSERHSGTRARRW